MKDTKQIKFWDGSFGKKYTDRNTHTIEAWRDLYLTNYGIYKEQLNESVLNGISKDAQILEVGCNTGMQLRALQSQGYNNLYGIELQWYAVELAKSICKNVNVIQGSGFDIPFKSGLFDIVCTNGVLIHIAPDDLDIIMQEMYRCTNEYIMGFEYYSENLEEINYRGNSGYLWKADYCKLFLDKFPDLELVEKKMVPFVSENEKGNVDCLYLLKKKQ